MTEKEVFEVTLLDIPEANTLKELIINNSCVEKMVRVSPKEDSAFSKIWNWIVKNKRTYYLGHKVPQDGEKERVMVFLKIWNGQPQIHVRYGAHAWYRFELRDYESEQYRLTAMEKNIREGPQTETETNIK